MNEERQTRGRSSLVIAVILLPAVYLLSIGPVWWMANHEMISFETTVHVASTVYAPIVWGADHCEPFRKSMEWYLDLWD